MKDFKVAAIGAGLMGGGIAQTYARAGYEVVNIDFYAPALDKARSNIEKLFDRKTTKGAITEEEKTEIMGRLAYSCDLSDVKGTGIVIEAVPKKMGIKKDTPKKADELADLDTTIVSNTSALSISEVASATGRADKIVRVHFFYPVPVMELVELIRSIVTSDDTYGKVRAFAIGIKKGVTDCPGLSDFIVGRILVPMTNEATFLVMKGCKPEDMDRAMKLGANHPMEPLELCDFVGVGVILTTITGLHSGFRGNKYRPCPILEDMAKARHLGRKMGQGFYQRIQQEDSGDE